MVKFNIEKWGLNEEFCGTRGSDTSYSRVPENHHERTILSAELSFLAQVPRKLEIDVDEET